LWAELRQLPATFVALQKQIPAADRAFLEHPRPLLHFEDQIEDFRDTAALAQLVDVVVTIDTAVAHLAGAMGRPTLVALPFAADWRWLLDREDSPWYPSARLVRQARQGDWMPVIRRLAHELHGYLG
jgi:ADP-heptose:LPS heptosyltransferase